MEASELSGESIVYPNLPFKLGVVCTKGRLSECKVL